MREQELVKSCLNKYQSANCFSTTDIGKCSHSLDSEVLCSQPGVINLQHQPGVVLCGQADLGKVNKAEIA